MPLTGLRAAGLVCIPAGRTGAGRRLFRGVITGGIIAFGWLMRRTPLSLSSLVLMVLVGPARALLLRGGADTLFGGGGIAGRLCCLGNRSLAGRVQSMACLAAAIAATAQRSGFRWHT